MIIINDENSLRIKCEDVLISEYNYLRDLLEKELINANRLGKSGIGLAAPQIGIAKKIAIIRLPEVSIDLVNCNIANAYNLSTFKEEGCLSFPGKKENTLRYEEVHITNNLVESYNFVATGLLSVVCQHEIGHFNQSLFFDHKVPVKIPIINNLKLKPNDLCFCGSGKKYKKCCK